MKISEIKELLSNHIVTFQYKKKNDELRTAVGTTNLNLIPDEFHPKGTAKQLSDNVVRYYDVEKQSWRSFIKTNFLKILS